MIFAVLVVFCYIDYFSEDYTFKSFLRNIKKKKKKIEQNFSYLYKKYN
jgi:NTP pyrophosphatase (non-canonical NTP hydrolase)